MKYNLVIAWEYLSGQKRYENEDEKKLQIFIRAGETVFWPKFQCVCQISGVGFVFLGNKSYENSFVHLLGTIHILHHQVVLNFWLLFKEHTLE